MRLSLGQEGLDADPVVLGLNRGPAFSRSGRFRMTVATRPSRRIRMGSLISLLQDLPLAPRSMCA
jgi:hypothetical protein